MRKMIRTSLALISIASFAAIGLNSKDNVSIEKNVNTVNLVALENDIPNADLKSYSFTDETTMTKLRVKYYEGTKNVDNMDIKFGGYFDAKSIYDYENLTLTVDMLEQHLKDYTYGVAIFDTADRNYVDQIGDEYEIKADIDMKKVLNDPDYTYALNLNELIENQFYKDPNASTKELKDILPTRVGMNWIIKDTLSIGYNFHFTAAMFKLDNTSNKCELASSKTHSTLSATKAYLGGNQINDETRKLLADFEQNYKTRRSFNLDLIKNNPAKDNTYPEDVTNLDLWAFAWGDFNNGRWFKVNANNTVDILNFDHSILFVYVESGVTPDWNANNIKYKTVDLAVPTDTVKLQSEVTYEIQFWSNDYTSDAGAKVKIEFFVGNKMYTAIAELVTDNGDFGDLYKATLVGYDHFTKFNIRRYAPDGNQWNEYLNVTAERYNTNNKIYFGQ